MKNGLYILIVLLTLSFALGVKKEIKEGIREEESKFKVFGADGKERSVIDDLLEAAFACLRNLLIEGDEESGFPSLQEIAVPVPPIDIGQEGLFSFKADVTNFVVYGLANFTINKVQVNIEDIILEYDFEFHMTTSGQYANGDLKVLDIIDVQGDGDLNLKMVINPLGSAKISFKEIGPGPEWVIEISELDSQLYLRPDFQITGIMHDEEISSAISKQISLLIEHYMRENADALSQQFSPIIMEMLNEMIQNPDSSFQDLVILALQHCPDFKFFMELLQGDAVKQGFIKN